MLEAGRERERERVTAAALMFSSSLSSLQLDRYLTQLIVAHIFTQPYIGIVYMLNRNEKESRLKKKWHASEVIFIFFYLDTSMCLHTHYYGKNAIF